MHTITQKACCRGIDLLAHTDWVLYQGHVEYQSEELAPLPDRASENKKISDSRLLTFRPSRPTASLNEVVTDDKYILDVYLIQIQRTTRKLL